MGALITIGIVFGIIIVVIFAFIALASYDIEQMELDEEDRGE